MILKILGILWVAERLVVALIAWLYRKRGKELEEYRERL